MVCMALRDANSIIRIRFEHSRWLHWGAHSGYLQFVSYLDPQHFRTVLHGAAVWDRPRRPLLKALIHRLRYRGRFTAELLASASCLAGRTDIVHFLDGEDSPQFLPRFVRLSHLSRIKTVVTFHQPPQILRKR